MTEPKQFYASEGLWKNTLHPEMKGMFQPSTVSTVTIHHHDDCCCTTEHYYAYIAHVHGFHGKGFMPCIRFKLSPTASMANGQVSYGTSREAIQKALDEAKKICERMNDEMNKKIQTPA